MTDRRGLALLALRRSDLVHIFLDVYRSAPSANYLDETSDPYSDIEHVILVPDSEDVLSRVIESEQRAAGRAGPASIRDRRAALLGASLGSDSARDRDLSL
jgi:hypothetical protein